MRTYATVEPAIQEARRQSTLYNESFAVPRNLVLRVPGGYAAQSVGNSMVREFCREYELVGEVIGVGEHGRYSEFFREDLEADGCKVSD